MGTYSPQNQCVFSNVQGQINGLVNMYAPYNVVPEFDSIRYNHINLDTPELHSDDDVLTARIFPKHDFQYGQSVSVGIAFEAIKDHIVNITIVLWDCLKVFLNSLTRVVLLMDVYCEHKINGIYKYVCTVYESLQKEYAEEAKLSQEDKNSSHIPTLDGSTVVADTSFTHGVIFPEIVANKQSSNSEFCTWSTTNSVIRKEIRQKKPPVLRYALKMVYEELIHGGHTRHIDRA